MREGTGVLGAMVPAVNFHALSKTEFHEKEAGCALSVDGSDGESGEGVESDEGAASWSRAGLAGEASTSTAAEETASSGSAVAIGNGRSSAGERGAGSSSGICIAASETCSQGIGDDSETNAISPSLSGAGAGAIGSSGASTSGTLTSATGASETTPLSSVRNEARIDSSKPGSDRKSTRLNSSH